MSQAAAAPAEAPKKKGKLMLIIILAVVLLAGGGGAAWFFLKPSAGGHAAKAAPAKPAVFLPLETFTGNLLPQDGQPQYIQLGITLKLQDEHASEAIKARMPEVRNRLLMVLSGKKGADLLPVAGKQKLATEIEVAIRQVVGPALAAHEAPEPEEVVEAPAPAVVSEANAAEGEHAEQPKPAPKPKRTGAPIGVLFTSFIIQ